MKQACPDQFQNAQTDLISFDRGFKARRSFTRGVLVALAIVGPFWAVVVVALTWLL